MVNGHDYSLSYHVLLMECYRDQLWFGGESVGVRSPPPVLTIGFVDHILKYKLIVDAINDFDASGKREIDYEKLKKLHCPFSLPGCLAESVHGGML